jgi:hypothetical protein
MKYKCMPRSKPEVIFPFTKKFNGNEYRQSLINPETIVNCTLQAAKERIGRLRKEGWAARIVKYETTCGLVSLIYERRTGREMKPKRGHKLLGAFK